MAAGEKNDSTCWEASVMGAADARNRARKRFDSIEQEAFLELWRAYDRLKAVEEELFSQHELSAQQYNALRLLMKASPETLRVNAIAERLVSRAPDMTRMLDRLEQRGLIHRSRPADNRRVVDVGITAAGAALLETLATPVRECHRRQLGHLSEDELRTLIDLLVKTRIPHEPVNSSWGNAE